MSLKELVNLEIYAGKSYKGVCRGVGVSLKSFAVKYLLCSSAPSANSRADFAVSVQSIESIGERILLSKLRPAHPQNYARVFLDTPVYAFDGVYLGKLTDLSFDNFTATHLTTDQNERYPITAVAACLDAVILKKEQPYPLGQRIPAPFLPFSSTQKERVVTRPVLREAIRQGDLIKLTLSLPPFSS